MHGNTEGGKIVICLTKYGIFSEKSKALFRFDGQTTNASQKLPLFVLDKILYFSQIIYYQCLIQKNQTFYL
jgi:hypothetical protein